MDSLVHFSMHRKTNRRGTMKTIGIRLDNPNGYLPDAGDYGRDPRGDWFGMTPNGHLANLSAHAVVEHEDRTVTVHPSILVRSTDGAELWHGFLRNGVWEPCGHYWEGQS